MAHLTEHIGFVEGIAVQIADRPYSDPNFRSVVLQEPEFDALEPFLKAAEPTLHTLWRYGVTDLGRESADRLAEALIGLTSADDVEPDHLQVFQLLGGWIRARLDEGRSIHVFGY